MLTNAPTIYDLEGDAYQIGGSVSGLPFFGHAVGTLGAEFNIIPNSKGGHYYGITLSGGVATHTAGTPIGMEVHAEWGSTKTVRTQRGIRPAELPLPIFPTPEEKARAMALIEAHPVGSFDPLSFLVIP